MKRIITTEWRKLPKKSNYVFLALIILIYAALSYLIFSTFPNDSSLAMVDKQSFNISFKVGSILLSIFIITNIGQEYKNGTLRKNIIDGYTRNDFYIGKISILLLAVFFVLILNLLSLTFGAIIMGKLHSLQELLEPKHLTTSFINLTYHALFAHFLIFTLRKITISIVLYFLWGTIESILNGLQQILEQQGNFDFSFNLAEYLPLASIDHVINATSVIKAQTVIIPSIYILIFILLPYRLFKKSDLNS